MPITGAAAAGAATGPARAVTTTAAAIHLKARRMDGPSRPLGEGCLDFGLGPDPLAADGGRVERVDDGGVARAVAAVELAVGDAVVGVKHVVAREAAEYVRAEPPGE